MVRQLHGDWRFEQRSTWRKRATQMGAEKNMRETARKHMHSHRLSKKIKCAPKNTSNVRTQ